jgi:hypothetical protein
MAIGEKGYQVITIICFLAILAAIILMIVGTFKMHEAIVRGKALHEKCGSEYYEAETVRYQVYDQWENKGGKEIFNVSAIFTIVVICVVLAVYIGLTIVDTTDIVNENKKWPTYILIYGLMIAAYCLFVSVGIGLLYPDSGIKLYGVVDDESSLTKRIAGSLSMIVFIIAWPLFVFAFDSFRKDNEPYSKVFGPHGPIYKMGWTLIRIVVTVAVINLIYALMLRNGIYKNYYDPTNPNEGSTGKLNSMIKNKINDIRGLSVAAEAANRDKDNRYDGDAYALYKKIYQGVNEVERPENGVDEGTLNDTTNNKYQPYFKYLKHSLDVNEVLTNISDPSNDYTTIFTSLSTKDEAVSKPINKVFSITMSILVTITVIPIYLYFHSQYKTKPNFLLSVGMVILVVLLFSFFYVLMSQSLVS